MKSRLLAVIVLGLMVIVLACQSGASVAPSDGSASTTVATPDPTSTPSPLLVAPPRETEPITNGSSGRALFVAKGCSACHGENAEGTDFAPALPGHSEAQVIRQARAPVGLMPLFPPDKISNEELQALAEYVGSLEGGHGHMRPASSGDEIVMHHWMALFAIEDDEVAEARHHVEHIIGLTAGQHLSRMKDTLELLEAGDIHGSAHIVEEMLAGLDNTVTDQAAMHLKLALSSVRIEDADGSIHHMEHFIGSAAGGEKEAGETVLTMLNVNDLEEAEHVLEQLLGGDTQDDGHADDDHDAVNDDEHADDDHDVANEDCEAHDDDHAADDDNDDCEAHEDDEDQSYKSN